MGGFGPFHWLIVGMILIFLVVVPILVGTVLSKSRKYRQPEIVPFVSGHNRAIWTICLLTAGMCLDVVGIGSTYLQVQLISGAQQAGTIEQREADSNDARQALIGIAQVAMYVGTAIAFLIWFHRAHRNLPALGAQHLEYSPRWAVGLFFIPIVNLYRPYMVMKEVWRGSDPGSASIRANEFERAPASPIVGLWWVLFISMGFAGQVSSRALTNAEGFDALLTASCLGIISELSSLTAALVTILMIWKIDANQEQRSRGIADETKGEPDSARAETKSRIEAQSTPALSAAKPKLTPCPDCGRMLSWLAVACPQCGRPMSPATPSP